MGGDYQRCGITEKKSLGVTGTPAQLQDCPSNKYKMKRDMLASLNESAELHSLCRNLHLLGLGTFFITKEWKKKKPKLVRMSWLGGH